eukprot:2393931-Amphidinium_carterae.1
MPLLQAAQTARIISIPGEVKSKRAVQMKKLDFNEVCTKNSEQHKNMQCALLRYLPNLSCRPCACRSLGERKMQSQPLYAPKPSESQNPVWPNGLGNLAETLM